MNLSRSTFLNTLTALIVVGLASSHAKAQALAFTTTGSSQATNSADAILGLDLTFASTVTVTGIGVWVGTNTANAGQTAGIYDQSGTLLASATLTGGAATDGAFRMTPLSSPLALSAGTYRVAAFYRANVDRFVIAPSITAAGGVTLGQRYRVFPASGLAFPTATTPSTFYGPNVLFQSGSLSASAPEPGTLALLAFGGLGILARRRRK